MTRYDAPVSAGDLRRLHRRVESVMPPMPAPGAPGPVWDAWMDLQDLQATLSGLVGRAGAVGPTEFQEWRDAVSAHLAAPSVRALLGAAAEDADSLAGALGVLGDDGAGAPARPVG